MFGNPFLPPKPLLLFLAFLVAPVRPVPAQSAEFQPLPLETDRLILTDLHGDIAGAKAVEGSARCGPGGEPASAPSPPAGPALIAGTAVSIDKEEMVIPIDVQGIGEIRTFRFTLVFNPFRVRFDSADPTGSTTDWEITSETIQDGRVMITGVRGEEGRPVTGGGTLVMVTMKCADRCPCETTVRATSLGEDLAPAQEGQGTLRFVKGEVPPQAPPSAGSGFRVEVASVNAACKQGAFVPVTVHEAQGMKSFTFSVLYDESCAKVKDVKPGLDTSQWTIKWNKVSKGMIVVSGFTFVDGDTIDESGEIARIKFTGKMKPVLLGVVPCALTSAIMVFAGFIIL